MKAHAKKHLGQNFLINEKIQQRIVDSAKFTTADVVLEIGPGQGAITRLIAPQVKHLVCIEKDRDLIAHLKQEFTGMHVEIINGDFLSWDMKDMPNGFKAIGNIPYNISTRILEKLIQHAHLISQAVLTVQLEFGERLAAAPGGKDYGALTCFTQLHADVRLLFTIKSTAFKPAPKVDSCCVLLDFSKRPPFDIKDQEQLFRMIRHVFTQRRKTFINAAQPMYDKIQLVQVLERLNISPQIRPEGLSLQNFVDISNNLV